jgi:tRNA G46 methylase TrmB
MREFNPHSIPKPNLPEPMRQWPKSRPMDLEIGAGQGLHAIHYALENTGRTLIALERTENRFAKFHQRFINHGAPANLIPFRADAIPFVVHFIEDESLDRVFLLYPNPYPKAKQANLRWHFHPFIQCVNRKLKSNGTLHLATNLEWYEREAVQALTGPMKFKLLRRRQIAPNSEALARTHFERKYLARGETCFDLVFQKRLQ